MKEILAKIDEMGILELTIVMEHLKHRYNKLCAINIDTNIVEKDWNLYPNNKARAYNHLDDKEDNISHELEIENNMLLAKRDSDFRSFQGDIPTYNNPLGDEEEFQMS